MTLMVVLACLVVVVAIVAAAGWWKALRYRHTVREHEKALAIAVRADLESLYRMVKGGDH